MQRVKIGVVGCGAIAQVHHLPNLTDLHEQFQVQGVCDISKGTAAYVADRFGVPQYYTDYRDLLASNIEAVVLCHSDPKTEVAVAALDAGKHVLIEKPMCFSLEQADRIIAAQERAGVVGMVAYMKVFDPAYEYAKREVEAMGTIRFVQVNHLHPDNALHTKQFTVRYVNDIPAEAKETTRRARDAERMQAIGEAAPHVVGTFFMLAGSMIHDLYGLRVMVGQPSEVVSTEIWLNGRAATMVFAYPNGARCVASWVDLPKLWDFRETLEVYGDEKRVRITYPTGFARGVLSTVTVQEIDARGTSLREEPNIDWETAFRRELRHFHECITEGKEPRTPVQSARNDIKLIIDIIEKYKQKQG